MKNLFISLAMFMLPAVAFAQTISGSKGVFGTINELLKVVYPILFAVAILFFLFQLAMFLLNTGDKKDDAKTGMIWGVIILVVMFSITGIISLLQSGLGLESQVEIKTPKVPGIN